MQNNPKISIVTVVYNAKDDLEKTIQNIVNQTYKNIEYIVIDGGSKDGTVDIIKNHEDKIDSWISEQDGGIYDAMNKGIAIATGDFINFMNAGDIFFDEKSLEKVVLKMDSNSKTYFGRAKTEDRDISWIYPSYKFDNKNIDIWLKSSLPNHQTMFFPKQFYKNYRYNLKYKIGSDSDYKFQAQKECGFCFIDEVIAVFELGGISTHMQSLRVTKQILHDSWYISLKHKGVLFALIRQFKIISKYLLNTFLGSTNLKKLLKRWRK
jgi:putative colanic acid biosynthesis glycosyltransferase